MSMFKGERTALRPMMEQPESRIEVPRRLEARKNAQALAQLLEGLYDVNGFVHFGGIDVSGQILSEVVTAATLSVTLAMALVIDRFDLGAATVVEFRTGTGTPEGAVTAPVGSLFLRSDGGAATTLYIKESGAGNTGWVAK